MNIRVNITFTTVRGVPMILSFPACLETDWHVSFLENFCSYLAPGNKGFEITIGCQKNEAFKPFDFYVFQMRLDERIPNLVSDLKSDNI